MAAAAAVPIPIPCVAEPTAASRVSPGSSPARSDASEGAAFYAADTEAEPEASVGRSTQMLLAMAAMGGRGGPYGRRPASSYGSCAAWSAGSLTDHRPASPSPICSPVSSNGGEGCRDGDDASSFVTPRLVSFRVLFPGGGAVLKVLDFFAAFGLNFPFLRSL